MSPSYPNVHVQLTDHDGNVFSIVGSVAQALRREVSIETADHWSHEALNCDSYDEVLLLAANTVSVH